MTQYCQLDLPVEENCFSKYIAIFTIITYGTLAVLLLLFLYHLIFQVWEPCPC